MQSASIDAAGRIRLTLEQLEHIRDGGDITVDMSGITGTDLHIGLKSAAPVRGGVGMGWVNAGDFIPPEHIPVLLRIENSDGIVGPFKLVRRIDNDWVACESGHSSQIQHCHYWHVLPEFDKVKNG